MDRRDSESTPPPGWTPDIAPGVASPRPTDRRVASSPGPRAVTARWPAGLAALMVITIAVVLLLTGGGGLKVLHGSGFSTEYPSGWADSARTAGGESAYLLGSDHTLPDSLGIPAHGQIGMTIAIYPVAFIDSELHRSLDVANPAVLVGAVTGTPGSATGVALVAAPHDTTLGGQSAGAEAFHYDVDGVADVQADVAGTHDGLIAFIEVDSQPGLVSQAKQALNDATSHWRW